MYKKILAMVVALAMIMTLGICAVQAEATSFGVMDAEAVASGTDAYWKKSADVVLYSDETYGTGIIAKPGTGNVTTSDTAFTSAQKRAWGRVISKNTVTEELTPSYTLTFDLTSVEGMYAISHGGCYIYLRNASTGMNYLGDYFAINIRRNWTGAQQIGIKPVGNNVAMSKFISITNENVDLADTTIKVVDNFVTDTVKVYATDADGEYQLIGTVVLDCDKASATLTNAAGASQSYTGYANGILDSSSTPMFILNEYGGIINNAEITYPADGPVGSPANVKSGIFMEIPQVSLTLSTPDSFAWYTVDGTDPIENIDNANLYMEGDEIELNPDGLDLPATFTLKTVEEVDGEYSDVLTYTYTVYPESASYTLNPAEVAGKTSADFAYNNAFKAYTVDSENDAFGVGTWNWSHVYSKFAVPTLAGSMEYNFDITNLNNDGATQYGVFLAYEAPGTANMTSSTYPYIYFTRKGIGFRKNESWSGNAATTIAWPAGLTLTTGKHHFRVVTEFGGKTLFYVDDVYAAQFEIAEDGTLTVTNADGVSASRTGAVRATDKAYADFAVYNSTSENLKVQNFEVSYPAGSETYPTATVDAETIDGYVGGDDVVIPVVTDSEDALVYYTTDGTVPTEDSEIYDGEAIVIPALDATGTVTVKVRPYNGYWGPTDTVKVSFKEPTVTYAYDFDDESYLDTWFANIGAGGTTMFENVDGKLTPDTGWSMFNTNFTVTGGKTNTVAFDLQDMDAESVKPLGIGIRNTIPGKWFNEVSSTSHIYLMFRENQLGLRNNSGSSGAEDGFTFIEVDADFANETRVILKDSVEANIIGIYVQDTAGTTEPQLIAYISIDEQQADGKVTPYVSLYSMKGESIENVPFGADYYKKDGFVPVFMTYGAAGGFTVDNVEIVVDNVNAEVINTMGAPVLEEMVTNSEYFKAVKIVPVGADAQKVYYTTDGTTPSKENGELYVQGTYIVIADNTTVSAISYNEDETIASDVTSKDYEVELTEYYQAPFDAAEVYNGTSESWYQKSNNKNNIPSIKVNEDDSFTFAGSEKETGGGVGMIATKQVFDAENNPVTITEFDAKQLGTGKNHQTFFFGMRKESYGGTEMTNNNEFFIKLSGSQIGFKNEAWGSAYEGTYLPTNTSFNSDSTEYQHYVFIDDKVNNAIWLFVDGMYLGKYQFSTTELENDTVTLTSVTGETVSRTYTKSIPTSGQFFIGQAYMTKSTFDNLVTYSGNTCPEFGVIFDAGIYGTIEGDGVYSVIKYSAVGEVPEVITGADVEFIGWTLNGGDELYTSEEVAAMTVTEDLLFEAKYVINDIAAYSINAKVTGTAPVFLTGFELAEDYEGAYDFYYTTDGTVPSKETGKIWDGTVVEFTADATVKVVAVAEDGETKVYDIAVNVNETEMNKAVVENARITETYIGTKANDDYFSYTDNRGNNDFEFGLRLTEEGTLLVDGTNYQPQGSGVSAITAKNDFAANAETVVYSFDVRNADTSDHVAFQAIYFGVRATERTDYGALVNNLNPMIALKGNKIGFKNNTWGHALDLYSTIPEYKGIASDEWVNIKIIDDRTTDIITVLADNKVIGTYKINGKSFTFVDVNGNEHTKDYLNEIAAGGQFYLGSAYCTMELDNVTEYTGVTRPEYTVTFDMGELGTTTEVTEYTVTKFDTVPGVPEAENVAKHYSFDGYTKNGGTRVYTPVQVATMPVDGNITFSAYYSQILTDVNITVENASAEKGRITKLEAKVESEAAVSGSVTFSYDATALEYVEAESEGFITDNGDGTLNAFVEGNETLVLGFKVLKSGTYKVATSEALLEGSDGEFLNIIQVDGTVNAGVLMGDADLDGKITVYDAVAVLKHIAGIEVLEGDSLAAASVTGGEALTVSDATTILKYLARIISQF